MNEAGHHHGQKGTCSTSVCQNFAQQGKRGVSPDKAQVAPIERKGVYSCRAWAKVLEKKSRDQVGQVRGE